MNNEKNHSFLLISSINNEIINRFHPNNANIYNGTSQPNYLSKVYCIHMMRENNNQYAINRKHIRERAEYVIVQYVKKKIIL